MKLEVSMVFDLITFRVPLVYYHPFCSLVISESQETSTCVGDASSYLSSREIHKVSRWTCDQVRKAGFRLCHLQRTVKKNINEKAQSPALVHKITVVELTESKA